MIKSCLCHLYLYIIIINFKIGTILRTNCKTFSPKNPSKKILIFIYIKKKLLNMKKVFLCIKVKLFYLFFFLSKIPIIYLIP